MTVRTPSSLGTLGALGTLLVLHVAFPIARLWILRRWPRYWHSYLSEACFMLFLVLTCTSWGIVFYMVYDYDQARKTLHLDEADLASYMFRKLHLKLYLCVAATYNIGLLSLKGAFLLLYFPISERLSGTVRRLFCALCFTVGVIYGANTIYNIAWCQPMNRLWEYKQIVPQKVPQCLPAQLTLRVLHVQYWTNLCTNALIMGFPLLLLRKLQLGKEEKYGLGFVFFLGGVSLCVSSVNYGIVVSTFRSEKSLAAANARLQLIAFFAETVTANIAFCLPAFRVLLRRHPFKSTVPSCVRHAHDPPGRQIFVHQDFEIEVASQTELYPMGVVGHGQQQELPKTECERLHSNVSQESSERSKELE